MFFPSASIEFNNYCICDPYRTCIQNFYLFPDGSPGGSTDKVEEKYMKLEIKVLKVQNTKKSKGIKLPRK